jgi:hypothetical protein
MEGIKGSDEGDRSAVSGEREYKAEIDNGSILSSDGSEAFDQDVDESFDSI